MNIALNRSQVAYLTNKSGGPLAQGAVGIVDPGEAAAFTTTTSAGYIDGMICVVLEPNGIADDAAGLVALSGYVPKINLSASADLGDLLATHTVAGQAAPHASPMASGDFAMVLGTGTSPAAILNSLPMQGIEPAQAYDAVALAADQAITTIADLTGLTLTKTLRNGIKYRWSFYYGGLQSSATGELQVYITDGSNVVKQKKGVGLDNGYMFHSVVSFVEEGAGASVTRKVRAAVSAGSFNFDVDTGQTIVFSVEEAG